MSDIGRPWVKIGARTRTVAEIHLRAARAARGFEQFGVGPGDVVATYLRNDFAMIEATVGAGLVGAYVTPINWHNTAEEARYVLENSGAKAVVIHADLLRRAGAGIPAAIKTIVVETPEELRAAYNVSTAEAAAADGAIEWESWIAGLEAKTPPFAVSPGSMICTSGTTGHPKGVRRNPPTPEEAASGMDVIRILGGLDPYVDRMQDVTLLIPGPAYHSSPNGWLFALLKLGANIVVEPKFDAERMLAVIARERVTHILAVPTMFVRLLALDESIKRRYDLSSIVQVMHVGAPCPPHIKRGMIDWWGAVITEHYGSTEVGAVTHCTAQEWLDHPGTVGRVIEGTIVVAMDSEGRILAPGESGEIVCGRPVSADFTYHGDDEKRRRSARGALVATGDVGYFDEDGFLYLSGRASDMIIFGGTNIYPAEIESELLKVAGVFDCAVFGIPDPDYGEQVCAFIQTEPGAEINEELVRDDLRARLASYKIPRRIEFVDSLPREDTGKIFKRKLREPFWQGMGRSI